MTLRQIAAQHGYHLDSVRARSQRGDWPEPVGKQANANVYDEAAIDAWFVSRSLRDDQWSMGHVSTELRIALGTIKTKRKRGKFPTPDGYLGKHPWWHSDTIRAWSRRAQVPVGAWCMADVRNNTGYREPGGIPGFPDPDGVAGRTRWWRPTAIVEWLRERQRTTRGVLELTTDTQRMKSPGNRGRRRPPLATG